MANGVAIDGEAVYVAATRDNSVFSFTATANGSLSEKQRVAKVKGTDNFYLHINMLYIASLEKISPSKLYRIDLNNNQKEQVFYNRGELISAVSVGIPYGDSLFLGQIFDSFVLKAMHE